MISSGWTGLGRGKGRGWTGLGRGKAFRFFGMAPVSRLGTECKVSCVGGGGVASAGESEGGSGWADCSRSASAAHEDVDGSPPPPRLHTLWLEVIVVVAMAGLAPVAVAECVAEVDPLHMEDVLSPYLESQLLSTSLVSKSHCCSGSLRLS